MNLADERLKELDNPSLTRNERVSLRCRLASEFIHIGQYEAAREALGELWQGTGKRPDVDAMPRVIAAEVLLQCGTLAGWLGSVRHVAGVQEQAKDLLFEALRMFNAQGKHSKAAECQHELGMVYWRLGSYDEARVVLDEALEGLKKEEDADLRAKILIRHTLVEVWTGRYHDAWRILDKARDFFEAGGDALKGRWHGQMAIVLMKLAITEGRGDYADRAIIEFTAAIVSYEQAGHERYCGINLNNLAYLFYKLGRYADAHEHLDRAREIAERHQDSGILAQVNETRARVLIAERHYDEARDLIPGVIQTFEKASEYNLLADALTVQGIVWARLGVAESSIRILKHAMNTAQDFGAYSHAGAAALTLIEEHGAARLSETELFRVYFRADELLKGTQDAEQIARLRACARIVMRRLAGGALDDKDFSLRQAVLAYEAKFIELALEQEQGSVTGAARRLGIRHQSLAQILKTRHKSLLAKRTLAVERRRSVMKKQDKE